VECFKDHDNCVISPVCSLKFVLNNALDAFLQVLDQYTIADFSENKVMLKTYFDSVKQNDEEPDFL